MKKILFLCNSYLDLYKIFQKGLEDYSGCEVQTIPIRFNEFKYTNLTQRVQNFFSKLLFGKNLKPFWISQNTISSLSKKNEFDYLLIICPELLDPKHFFRVNRNFIVSLNSISSINHYPTGKFLIELNPKARSEVSVSIDKITLFKEWLGK